MAGFKRLAHALKLECDKRFGPTWQCVVGKSFGSFVGADAASFLHFKVGKVVFLLYKTYDSKETRLLTEEGWIESREA